MLITDEPLTGSEMSSFLNNKTDEESSVVTSVGDEGTDEEGEMDSEIDDEADDPPHL